MQLPKEMNLHDWFAGQFLPHLIRFMPNMHNATERAYEWADQMVKIRQRYLPPVDHDIAPYNPDNRPIYHHIPSLIEREAALGGFSQGGFQVLVTMNYTSSDDVVYGYEIHYQEGTEKRMCNRHRKFESYQESGGGTYSGGWQTFQEAFKTGIEHAEEMQKNLKMKTEV